MKVESRKTLGEAFVSMDNSGSGNNHTLLLSKSRIKNRVEDQLLLEHITRDTRKNLFAFPHDIMKKMLLDLIAVIDQEEAKKYCETCGHKVFE